MHPSPPGCKRHCVECNCRRRTRLSSWPPEPPHNSPRRSERLELEQDWETVHRADTKGRPRVSGPEMGILAIIPKVIKVCHILSFLRKSRWTKVAPRPADASADDWRWPKLRDYWSRSATGDSAVWSAEIMKTRRLLGLILVGSWRWDLDRPGNDLESLDCYWPGNWFGGPWIAGQRDVLLPWFCWN